MTAVGREIKLDGQAVRPFAEYSELPRGIAPRNQSFEFNGFPIEFWLFRRGAHEDLKRRLYQDLLQRDFRYEIPLSMDIAEVREGNEGDLRLAITVDSPTNLVVISEINKVVIAGYRTVDNIGLIDRWQQTFGDRPKYYPVPDDPDIFQGISVRLISPPPISAFIK